jgi:hypothetical protein
MSAEAAKPVTETPTAPAVEPTPEVSALTTETPAVTEPAVAETKPAEETAAKAETTEAAASADAKKSEEKAPVEPKFDGTLKYNAPSNFLK